MGNFNKFGGDRGGRSFGGKGGFGGGNRFGGHGGGGPRPMFQATCNKCGQNCEIPFKPSGDRPVFCSNCFKTEGGPATNRFAPKSFGDGNNRGNFGGNSGGNAGANTGGAATKAQFDSLNAKVDKILATLTAMVEIKTTKEIAKKTKALTKKSKGKKK